MSITFRDHLVDIGYYDITPEQEREQEAREECARRGIDPDDVCADGGVLAWMVVDQEPTTKSTPGPWKFQYTDESGECFIIAENLGGMVGAALPWPTEIDARDFRRVIANARLMAAAPTLIEALQEARTQIECLQSMRGIRDTGHGTLSIIDAALAKAGVKAETAEEVTP